MCGISVSVQLNCIFELRQIKLNFHVLTSVGTAMGVIIQSHYIQTSLKVNRQAIHTNTHDLSMRDNTLVAV